ncbi:hypothetical protein BU9_CDS0071 [Klebsiella phage Kpn BU9]|nr:hypothetical protein BU9_CDS0071 [Klebsiella phage Kpn BU9]
MFCRYQQNLEFCVNRGDDRINWIAISGKIISNGTISDTRRYRNSSDKINQIIFSSLSFCRASTDSHQFFKSLRYRLDCKG